MKPCIYEKPSQERGIAQVLGAFRMGVNKQIRNREQFSSH